MPSATTTLGTPRAESWDDAWLAFVDETEQRLGRAICGAHAPDGEPCELGSTHPNGRCRFHGGHPRIGAQLGNTNALIHGLYSRRLRQCNNTCPAWHMCPFAGPDVTALSERKRPVCAYEREAYAIAMRFPDMEWSAAANFADTTLPDGAPTTFSGAGVPAREASTEASALRNLPFAFHKPDQTPREGIITHLQYRATPFFGRRGATTKFPRDENGDR